MFSVSLPSCSEVDANETTEYYCPMKCEGEKTYLEKGSCPVCSMNLKGKKVIKNQIEIK